MMKITKADICATRRYERNSCLTQGDRDDLAVNKAVKRAVRKGKARPVWYGSTWTFRRSQASKDRVYFHGELFEPERRAQFANARHVAHLMLFAKSGADVLP